MGDYNRELWASIIGLGVAVLFTVASFWGTDPEVYLFPRIISVFLLMLVAIQSLSTFKAWSNDTQHKRVKIAWRGLMPGLVISIIYVLTLEIIGFYAGTFLAFFLLVSVYGKRAAIDTKALISKITIGLLLVFVLYSLFWHLLNVRTPTGWLF